MMRNVIRVFLVMSAALWVQAGFAADDLLMKVMKDELTRSMAKLHLGELEKPYYIAYRIEDQESHVVSGNFGAVASDQQSRSRYLTVQVRVGDYQFDNTNFVGASGLGGAGRTGRAPLDDDYKEIRRNLWLATDEAYKRAVEDYSRKRAAVENVTRSEELPDFSEQEPAQTIDDAGTVTLDPDVAADLVREVSATFRDAPGVSASSVRLSWSNSTVRYLNSEGVSYTRTRPLVSFTASANAQAADGSRLEDSLSFRGRTMDELPDRAELTAQAREMASHVTKLREAPMLERYNGPVLFEGAAAAEVFSQVFASNLLGQRVPVAGDSRFQAEENPFLDKLGARVLPRFLSVVDDSTVTEYEGTPLLASYKADDEGTPSRRTELVENGMLQTLLTGRNPVRGIDGSTGNLRGSGPMPSCVFISAAEGLDRAALRARFIDEIVQRRKEYGVVVRRLGGSAVRAAAGRGRRGRGGGSRARNGAGIVAAYKLYPDGREELIRNAQFSDFAAAAFRDIIAVSRERTVHQAVFRAQGGSRFGRGGGGGARLVSWVVPDMLFEDLTLTRPRGEVRLPPVLKHPFFEGAAR